MNFQQSALQRAAGDADRGIALFTYIFYISPQRSERIHQNTYRTMLHPFRTCQDMCAWGNAEVGRHEAHGCSCRLDIDLLWHRAQCFDDYRRIIAVAQVLGQRTAATECVDNKCTV